MTEEDLKRMAAQLRKPEGEDGIKTADLMSAANSHIIRDTFNALAAEPFDNILEIGMGNGFYVNEILEKSDQIKYTGCDYSELMIEESKKINAGWMSRGQARFTLSNGTLLPFSDNTFNKVLTINTIYFWENQNDTLHEIKRVLKPGGKIIIAFRPKHQMEKYPFTKYGFAQFSKEDVDNLLSENGFSVNDIFENEESDFDLKGQAITRENVVVVAAKH